MITNAIINLAFGLTNMIVAILPDGSGFSQNVLDAAHTIGGYWGLFDSLISIPVLLSCVGIVFAVETSIFGWKTVKSIISHIPQFGGSGH